MKQKAEVAGLQHEKCEKGQRILYDGLELQGYLDPSSNVTLEDQLFLFSLRCAIFILKLNLRRNENMISSFCIKSCNQELDNEHLVFYQEINKNNLVRFENI